MTKTIKRVIAGISALAIIAGAAVGGWAINEYVIKDNSIVIENPLGDNGGAVIGESQGSGIKLMSTKIAAADYEEYGISAQAETAYQLTATITPANATNKEVDWKVSFSNPSASWASGKTVTDYVTVTPTSDGALTANVECKAAFGEKIKVTCTSRDNTSAKASATVDYTQKLQSVEATFGSTTLTNGMTRNFDTSKSGQSASTWDFDYSTSVYTIADDYTTTVKIAFNSAISTVESAVGEEFTWNGETITSGMPSFDKTFFDKVFKTSGGAVSSDPVTYNKLVTALGNGVNVFDVTVTTTGEYGSKTDKYTIKVTSTGLTVRVEGVELDEENIVF